MIKTEPRNDDRTHSGINTEEARRIIESKKYCDYQGWKFPKLRSKKGATVADGKDCTFDEYVTDEDGETIPGLWCKGVVTIGRRVAIDRLTLTLLKHANDDSDSGRVAQLDVKVPLPKHGSADQNWPHIHIGTTVENLLLLNAKKFRIDLWEMVELFEQKSGIEFRPPIKEVDDFSLEN